jgi:hypothetical protein
LNEKVAAPVWKTELTTMGIRFADHATPSISKKLALTSPTSGGRSVGIVRLRTKGHGVFFYSNNTNAMEQSPSGEINKRFPWVAKDHYHIQKSQPLVLIWSRMN